MALFMDVHHMDGGVSAADVAGAHQKDVETQTQYGVDSAQVVLAVPQRDGLGTTEQDRAPGVDVVERAGEGDDADPHAVPPSAQASSAPSSSEPSSST